jgi:hypothetical protein
MATRQTFVTSVWDRMRQAYCGLHGHDTLLQFARERMYLKCTSCGYESPGWAINGEPPATNEKAPRRAALLRHVLGVRRVA